MAKKVLVTGGTGFIGRTLCAFLAQRGYEVIVLTRGLRSADVFELGIRALPWDGRTSRGWVHEAEGSFAIINLAVENVASGRWTAKKKRRIMQSRIDAAAAVMDALNRCSARPRVLVQASAAGYYGYRDTNTAFTESAPSGEGFLAGVSARWEGATDGAETLGVRRVIMRTGIVLGRGGGALEKLMLPYRFFVGGHIGSGNQYLSWIHMDDEIEAILHIMEREELSGAFNFTAPEPARARDFAATLGRVLGRPAWTSAPAPVIRLVFGEMGVEALVSGQKVIPERLLASGFRFKHPALEGALRDLTGRGR
jgi:uncharacterized protein (TIGR01777 family)